MSSAEDKALKKRKEELKKLKEEFRESFAARMKADHGNVAKAAETLAVFGSSVSRWFQAGAGLPDIFDAKIMAEAISRRPAWLAFGDKSTPMTEAETRVVELLRGCTPRMLEGILLMLSRVAETKTTPIDAELLKHLGQISRDPEMMAQAPQIEIETDTARQHDLSEHVVSHDREKKIVAMTYRANEDPAPYPEIRPVENRARRINTRDQFPVYLPLREVSKHPRIQPTPKWFNLAAGAARALERCPEVMHFREFRGKDVHVAKIVGDSMLDTILPGDSILLQSLDSDKGLSLSALAKGDPKNPLNEMRLRVPPDSICVLAVNEPENVTLKRVRYQDHGRGDWYIHILADNPDEPGYPYTVRREDEITFWARMIGFVGVHGD